MDQSFFPNISYVQPGDTVTFINMSGVTRTVEAENKIWSIDSLADGAQATITVEAGWKNESLSRIHGADEIGTIIGRMSYSSPPSDAVAEDF